MRHLLPSQRSVEVWLCFQASCWLGSRAEKQDYCLKFAPICESPVSRAMTRCYFKDLETYAEPRNLKFSARSCGLRTVYRFGKSRQDLKIAIIEASFWQNCGKSSQHTNITIYHHIFPYFWGWKTLHYLLTSIHFSDEEFTFPYQIASLSPCAAATHCVVKVGTLSSTVTSCAYCSLWTYNID